MDLRNTRARLKSIAVAAVIGALFTFFTMKMIAGGGGRGPNNDPIAGATFGVLVIFVFVIETVIAHKVISKKRR
ncbi:MAG TPA: hypothetical protein VMZ53_30895 [Kofleriaceae bacterium]|nr:hypothetical protein [Kofleriaceae bacterium]